MALDDNFIARLRRTIFGFIARLRRTIFGAPLQLARKFRGPIGSPVWYPPAAPDAELLTTLHASADDAVCFRHVFPPRFDRRPTTFFGGLPLAAQPLPFAWPTGLTFDKRSVSHTFLAQIDCRDLPRFAHRGLLPESGILYFFADWTMIMDGGSGGAPVPNLVFYAPDDGAALAEAQPPGDLDACYGGESDHYYPWLEHTDRTRRANPKTFPKWAVDPAVLRTYADEHPHETHSKSAERYQELWEAEQSKASIAAFGRPVPQAATWHAPEDYSKVWRPAPGFPEAWISVEIFAGTLAWELTPPRSTPNPLNAPYETVLHQAQSWVETARAKGLFTPLGEAERQQFWSWCDAVDGSTGRSINDRIYDRRSARTLNRCIAAAFNRGPDYCLSHSAEAAALVSEAVREAVRWKHAPLVSGTPVGGLVRHQILGTGTSIQGAPERFRDTHLLLMQFDTDQGMDWMWGDCGVLQYWITPEDLKARRFDRVCVTLEGG